MFALNYMKTLATLHREQKEEFEQKFTESDFENMSERLAFLKLDDIKSFNTTSTLSKIDLMIEIVESKKVDMKNEETGHMCRFNDGLQTCDCYIQALSDLSTLLSAQRKGILKQNI